MSISRQLFREFRPLFRMLEEPLTRSPAYYASPSRFPFDDPFFNSPAIARPAVDVAEEGNSYVVEAELPGVQKENVEVRIGDGGRSVTIEGKTVDRRSTSPQTVNASAESTEGSSSTDVAKTDTSSNQISTERSFSGSATFTRTVWLPRPVDSNNVSAKLRDGILTVRVNKAEDRASVTVPVE